MKRSKSKRKELKQAKYELVRSRYPKFVFVNRESVPENFVEMVVDATKGVVFDELSLVARRFLACVRNEFDELYIQLYSMNSNDSQGDRILESVRDELMRAIVGGLPKSFVDFLPEFWFRVEFFNNDVRIVFSGLSVHKSQMGKIYYNAGSRKIAFGGKSYFLGWSKHALDRVKDRIVLKADGAGYDLVHSFVMNSYGLMTKLGDAAIMLFVKCVPGGVISKYVRHLVGDVDRYSDYFYKVGYCPLVVDGGYLKALTLLCPGYRTTPEYELLKKFAIPEDEKKLLLQRSREHVISADPSLDDLDLVKFFHDNGVLQLITQPVRRMSSFSNIPVGYYVKRKSRLISLTSANVRKFISAVVGG